MALTAVAAADAAIAVMDADIHYNFWRPILARRSATVIRQRFLCNRAGTQCGSRSDNTPMHPEYPCARPVVSTSSCDGRRASIGRARDAEVVDDQSNGTGRHASMDEAFRAYADEVALARIRAAFTIDFPSEHRPGDGPQKWRARS